MASTVKFVYNRKALDVAGHRRTGSEGVLPADGESESLPHFFWGDIKPMSIQNVLVVLISYIIGSLLPAELVSWVVKRRPCSEIGSGNPGFANITSSLGIFAGLIVLAGDIAKTYIGMRVAYDFTRGDTLLFTSLLSLCALVTGHNFPLWNLFRGGKGVTVTCTGIILITPTLGIPAVLIGFVLVLLTGWLPLGAVAIPAAYLLMCVFLLPEAVPFAIFLAVMMLIRHLPGLIAIFTGKCPRTSPFEIFKKTNRMVDEPEPEYDSEEEAAEEPEEVPAPAEPAGEDEFITNWLSENEGEAEAPSAETDAAPADDVSGEAAAADNLGPADAAASQTTGENSLAPVLPDIPGDAGSEVFPETDSDHGPAIWTIPVVGAAVIADAAETADSAQSSPKDSDAPDEEALEEKKSAQEALWKTGVLPSLEEIRRHRLRSMEEVPEARAATSPFQGRRHMHRGSSKEEAPEDGVIFYDNSEKEKE